GYPRDFTCIENKLAYLDNFTSNNLWVTDGTNKNTVAINVLNGEQLDNNEVAFIEGYSQNKLYFTADTSISGYELYAAEVSEILNVNDYYTQMNKSDDKIRSEERRVGKEWKSQWSPQHERKKWRKEGRHANAEI